MTLMTLSSDSGVVCLASLMSLAGPVLVAQSSGSWEPSGGLARLSRTLEDLSERVGPVVVQIFTPWYPAAQGRVAGLEDLLEMPRRRRSELSSIRMANSPRYC